MFERHFKIFQMYFRSVSGGFRRDTEMFQGVVRSAYVVFGWFQGGFIIV